MGEISMEPTTESSMEPSTAPVNVRTIPVECDESEGRLFQLEVQLDAKSRVGFGWKLTNQNVGTSGWASNQNSDLPINKPLVYYTCLPLNECWDLALSNAGNN